MLKLWCAGKLEGCPETVKRFRFTCLHCRIRRKVYGKFVDPSYWLEYTYLSSFKIFYEEKFVRDGLEYTVRDGRPLKVTHFDTLLIDPRGRFTSLRCAAIMVLDRLMKAFHVGKPLAEFCEFLANYPV